MAITCSEGETTLHQRDKHTAALSSLLHNRQSTQKTLVLLTMAGPLETHAIFYNAVFLFQHIMYLRDIFFKDADTVLFSNAILYYQSERKLFPLSGAKPHVCHFA